MSFYKSELSEAIEDQKQNILVYISNNPPVVNNMVPCVFSQQISSRKWTVGWRFTKMKTQVGDIQEDPHPSYNKSQTIEWVYQPVTDYTIAPNAIFEYNEDGLAFYFQVVEIHPMDGYYLITAHHGLKEAKEYSIRQFNQKWFENHLAYLGAIQTFIPFVKCATCYGEGIITHYENGAPHGAGYWAMPIEEECPDCLEKGICPNCAHQWSEDTFQNYIDWVSYDRQEKFYCPRCQFENW